MCYYYHWSTVNVLNECAHCKAFESVLKSFALICEEEVVYYHVSYVLCEQLKKRGPQKSKRAKQKAKAIFYKKINLKLWKTMSKLTQTVRTTNKQTNQLATATQ